MELETDLRRLAELSRSLEKAAGRIEDELGVLAQASRRFTTGWRGQAEQSYQQRYGQFATGTRMQVDALRDAAVALGELVGEYASTDQRSANAIPSAPLSRK